VNTKTFAAVWAALAILPVAGAAQAQETPASGVYASAGYTFLSPTGERDADIGALTVRGGYQINPYVGVEAEGAFGVDDGRFATGAGARGSYGLDYSIGAYGVARYPVTDRLDVFARAGVVHARFNGKATIANTTVRFDDKNEWLAGGAGVQFNIDPKNAIRAEYTRLEDNNDLDIDTFGVSFVRKF
jgi:outer membrane immunogenic protein